MDKIKAVTKNSDVAEGDPLAFLDKSVLPGLADLFGPGSLMRFKVTGVKVKIGDEEMFKITKIEYIR